MIDFEWLEKGNILPAFCLPSDSGEMVRLGELRGRRNLVLFMTHPPGCSACEEKLREFDKASGELRQEEAEVFAVVPGPAAEVRALRRRLGLSFPLLVEEPGPKNEAAVVVTDRFGEIFAAARSGEGHRLPTSGEISGELAFIGLQCPE